MPMNKLTRPPVGVLFPTIDTSQFPLHRVCHKEREALWRGPRWCFKRTRCGGNRRVLMVGNNTVGADLSRTPPIYRPSSASTEQNGGGYSVGARVDEGWLGGPSWSPASCCP